MSGYNENINNRKWFRNYKTFISKRKRCLLMKKLVKKFCLVFAILLVAYLVVCLSVSLRVNYVVSSAMNNKPYNLVLERMISIEDYEALCPVQPELEEGINTRRLKFHTLPITFLCNKKANFLWTYEVIDIETEEVVYGTWMGVPTIYFESIFPLRIYEVDTL